MTIDQMHVEFKFRGDSLDSQTFPDLTPAEIDAFLNNSIRIVVREAYKFDPNGTGFEVDEDKIQKLSTLFISSPEKQGEITPADLGNGVYEVSLSDELDYDLWWITRVVAQITKEGNSKYIRCTPKKVDQLEDRFSRPSFFWKRCPITTAASVDTSNDRSLYFYTDEDFAVSKARISYLKRPNRVFFAGYNHIDGEGLAAGPQVSCDLPEQAHDDVVNRAVLEAFRSIGHPNMVAFEKLIQEQFTK